MQTFDRVRENIREGWVIRKGTTNMTLYRGKFQPWQAAVYVTHYAATRALTNYLAQYPGRLRCLTQGAHVEALCNSNLRKP